MPTRPSEAEIMEQAKRLLALRIARDGRRDDAAPCPDLSPKDETRRLRSLRSCHLPAAPKPRKPSPHPTGAYIPELAARLEDDLNLTDGARRCARKLAEYIYRSNREGRASEITVTYLMSALGKCRRTVQRYLRQLEREGYIGVQVVHAGTRMCAGLLVELLAPLLPRHRREKWPQSRRNPDATQESQNNRNRYRFRLIPRAEWATRCQTAIFSALVNSLGPPPSLLSSF